MNEKAMLCLRLFAASMSKMNMVYLTPQATTSEKPSKKLIKIKYFIKILKGSSKLKQSNFFLID